MTRKQKIEKGIELYFLLIEFIEEARNFPSLRKKITKLLSFLDIVREIGADNSLAEELEAEINGLGEELQKRLFAGELN